MKKLIFRKILKDIFYFFLLVSLSITIIVWVIQAVNFLDIFSEDGHSLLIYFKYTLMNLPKIFSRTLIFIFFISIFYIILKYESNNELMIFWNNGISKKYFINILILFSLPFLIIQIVFTSYLVPSSQDKARSYIRDSNIDSFTSLIKEKKFIDTVSNLTIFIERKKKDGSFERIFLKENIIVVDGSTRSQIIYAQKGKIITLNEKNYLKLYNGKIINSKNKKTNTFSFKETEIDLSKYKTKTTTFPKMQELSSFVILKCVRFKGDPISDGDIASGGISGSCDKNSNAVYKHEFFKRLYGPLYIPLLALISSLLILRSKENYNFKKFRNFIFVLGISFIILSEITTKYFGNKMLNNLIYLSLPLLAFFLIYSILFTHTKKNLT